ncbi:MAG: ferrochelatase [Limisphaerales bacterium]|jgi:ferrochelatase
MALTGILLVNLGTPDSPSTADVRKYLKEFLLDERVIDIPWFFRQALVRGLIAPFRAPKSAKIYQEIWFKEGSPLMVYGRRLLDKMNIAMGSDFEVELAMRYQNPSIEKGIDTLLSKGVDRIIIFPLFPQYASATTGSIHEKVMNLLGKRQNIPDIHLVRDYFDHPAFISAFASRADVHQLADFDHILFSFHGLPERQIRKADNHKVCLSETCCKSMRADNCQCYRAQCHATARAIAKEKGIKEEDYTICFQSRLGSDPWIKPYTSDVIEHLAKKGVKKMLVFCPAFVADCIETIDEIAVEYADEFKEAGGESLTLVESLNDSDAWVAALRTIILEKSGLLPDSKVSQNMQESLSDPAV